MATPFHLEVVTPERVLFAGEVVEVSMRTDGGEIAFLARHEDYVGAVDITVARLSVVDGGEDAESAEVRIAVHGGFVHVSEDGMTILAGIAELADEIDVDRARAALSAAEERFAEEGPATKPAALEEESVEGASSHLTGAMVALLAPDSAEAAVARAKARLEAAGVASSA